MTSGNEEEARGRSRLSPSSSSSLRCCKLPLDIKRYWCYETSVTLLAARPVHLIRRSSEKIAIATAAAAVSNVFCFFFFLECYRHADRQRDRPMTLGEDRALDSKRQTIKDLKK